jgi:uncharacterized protein YbcV (DUF1398 family)
MNTELVHRIAQGSLNNAMTFPEVVQLLGNAGIESYHVDLVRRENRYYMPSGETHVISVAFEHPPASVEFAAHQVASAVKGIQAGSLTYPAFLHAIMAAGTVYYIVYITGRRVMYLGHQGDVHVEYFPQK